MPDKPSKPRAPADLGGAGRTVWRRLVSAYAFEEHELAVLETACRQADDVAALEVLIANDGLTVAGSAGQPRLNPAVAEARQGRIAFAKLLGALALPAEDGKPQTHASRTAQKAANVRWSRTREAQERRAAGGTA